MFKTIRLQSARLVESNLQSAEEGCQLRTMCALGANPDSMESTTSYPSIMNGLKQFYGVLTDMVDVLEELGGARGNYPKLHQTVAA